MEVLKKLLYFLIMAFAASACNYQNAADKKIAKEQEIAQIQKRKADSISKVRLDSTNAILNAQYPVSGKVLYRKMWCGGVQIKPGDNCCSPARGADRP